jgi:hypothetical protein
MLAPILCEPPRPLVDHPELWVVQATPPGGYGWHVCWSEDGDEYHGTRGEYRIGQAAVAGRALDALPASEDVRGVRLALAHGGTLPMADAAAARRLQTLCYVGDGTSEYELVAYTGLRLIGKESDGAHVYRLDGLVVRGAYGTRVRAWPAGSRFARLDDTVARIPIPIRLLMGPSTLLLRLVPVDASGERDGMEEASEEPLGYRLTARGIA